MIWLPLAWAWLKKNWKVVLLGVFTFGVSFLIGRALRKPTKVVAPALVGAAEVKEEAEGKAEKQLEEAAGERDKAVAKVELEHKATIEKLTKEQEEKLPELRGDPEKLNSFLLDVGKEMRSSG